MTRSAAVGVAALLALAAAGLIGFFRLSARLAAAGEENAALAAALELSGRGSAAADAVAGDLGGAARVFADDDEGRAWLACCAFPVSAAPAGGTTLPQKGRATILLLLRPMAPMVFDGGEAPLVRLVAWYPAESTETPSLQSWESEPMADGRALAAMTAEARRAAVEALVRARVATAWDPGAAGPRALDVLGGDVAKGGEEAAPLAGVSRNWCGSTALSRGLGHPAFYAEFSGLPDARRADIHLTIEVRAGERILRQEFSAVAVRTGG